MTDSEKLDLILEKIVSLDEKMDNLETKVSELESDMQTVSGRLDKIESKLEMLYVWQKKTVEHVTELKVMQELFELNANKRFAKLQDGLETMDEILRINDLIPQ